MSTGQIKRYNAPWVTGTFGSSRVNLVTDSDGEFVKYTDHVKRVEELEGQLEFEMNEKAKARDARNKHASRNTKLERKLDKIFKIVSCFNGGVTPIGCDGVIWLKVDEYNKLVEAINTKTE